MSSLRKREFDIAKAMAIYMVVYGHIYYSVFGRYSSFIDFCHMPIFFFVSGYFLWESFEKYSFGEFCVRKTKSLLFPYLCWSMVSFAANIGINWHSLREGVLKESIDIFFYSRSVWFLIELYVASIFFGFWKVVATKYHINQYLLWVGAWLIISVIIPGEPFAFYKFKWLFPFMIAGVFCAERGIQNRYKYIGAASLALYVIVSHTAYSSHYFNVYGTFEYSTFKEGVIGLLYYSISFWGVWGVISAARICKKRVAEICGYVGRYSIDIYVIHMFLIRLHFWQPSFLNNWVVAIYTSVYSVIIVGIILLVREKVLKHFKIYEAAVGR